MQAGRSDPQGSSTGVTEDSSGGPTRDPERKRRLAAVIDQLYELGGELPPRINETRRRLANQIARSGVCDTA
jgi:hypothetical protein